MNASLSTLDQLQQAGRWRGDAAWLRARAQLEFAHWLAQQPGADAQWPALVADTINRVARLDQADQPLLVSEIETRLRPMSAAAKQHVVCAVGHAHIDMNWMWGWNETANVTLDSFRTMLTLLEEFPEFHFSQSQAAIYAIVEQYDPAMLKRIAKFVKEGRWEVTASHWVENDANLAGAEALVQQVAQSRAYLRELFGLAPEDVAIDWAPDTFGFAATTPSYLAQAGVRHVFMHRPGDLRPVPEAFAWRGPDGAQVLAHNAYHVGFGYNAVIGPKTVTDAARRAGQDGRKVTLVSYGVGDHGGGPTRRDLLLAREMAQWPVFPTLTLTTTRDYFSRLEKIADTLPVMEGELNIEFSGCYTTQTLIKRDNRLGESRLRDTETAAALVQRLGLPAVIDERDLAASWRRVLFSQFHDILPGSCMRDSRMFTHGEHQRTLAFTSTTTARLLRELADRVNTSGPGAGVTSAPADLPALHLLEGFGAGAGIATVDGGLSRSHGHGLSPVRPFVVANLTGSARTEVVLFPLWDREFPETAGQFDKINFEAVTVSGAPLPAQRLQPKAHSDLLAPFFGTCGHACQTYAAAVTVPAFGYTTVIFRERLGDAAPLSASGGTALRYQQHPCPYSRSGRSAAELENEHLRVKFDGETGRVISLFDKAANTELLDPAKGGIGLEYSVERSDSVNDWIMSAWIIDQAGKVTVPTLVKFRALEAGPVRAAVEATYRVERSTITLVWRLDANSRRLELWFSADWLEAGTAATGAPNLRLAAATALPDPALTCEIPFGSITRRLRADCEVAAQRWALVESAAAPAALLVANDCKYGHALADGTLRLNLIRSAFDPDPFPELGKHLAAFAFEPVPRGADHAQLAAKSEALHHPLLLTGTPVHDGPLAPEAALVSVSGANIAVSVLQRAAAGDGLLLRLYNTAAAAAEAVVKFDPSLGALASATPADLLGRPVNAPLPLSANTLTVSVPPRGIATYVVK